MEQCTIIVIQLDIVLKKFSYKDNKPNSFSLDQYSLLFSVFVEYNYYRNFSIIGL